MFGDKKTVLAKKVFVIYLIIGSSWIIISGLISSYLSEEIKDLFYIESIKGMFYVITTAIILYFYIKKLQKRLTEFSDIYQLLFQNSINVMLIIDPENGLIIDANKSAENFYGYSKEELKKLKIWDINILPEEKVIIEMEKAKKIIKNFFQFKHRLKNGEIKDVEVYSSPINFKNKIYLFSTIYDVTDKIEREKELNKILNQHKIACQNLSNFIDFSPLPIIGVNKEGIITLWNKAAEKLFGWTKEEAIGTINPIVPEEKKVEFKNLLQRAIDGETIKDIEIERVDKEGKYLLLRAFIAPMLSSQENIPNIIAILEDITEKKRLEQEFLHSKKMEAIGKLSAGISHDFNNMLTAIINFANLIELKAQENEEIKKYAKQILMVSERATNLTKALLTYSRKMPFNPKILNINDLIKSSIGYMEKIIGENIVLKLILKEDIHNIYADPYQLEHILINLLSNAKDAMPEGGIIYIETQEDTLDKEFIKSHRYGKVGRYVKISISDTGTGIGKEIQDKIFDPFYTTKADGKGTGIGLSIVYGIVKQHNGYINLYSEKGRGTTFNIYLPITEEEQKKEQLEDKIDVIKALETKDISILIADDDENIRTSINSLLTSVGYKVFEASNGEEAINIFSENKDNINLLILDVIMPDLNGFQVLEKIREIKEDIKVILISGYNIEMLEGIKTETKGEIFLQKPLSLSKLIETINKIFR